jgi:protein SCO1/2
MNPQPRFWFSRRNAVLTVILLVLCFVQTNGQYVNRLTGDSIEVGIVEHLGESIPLNAVFRNEGDSLVRLADVLGKPTLLVLVYYDCPGICSIILDAVADVIEKTDLQLGKEYRVITISFNPADTPEKSIEKKKNFIRKSFQDDASGWIFLTGDSTNIYRVTNSVGFKFKKSGFDFIHPAAITVISPKGKITRYLYGTSYLPFDVKMALYESQKGLVRPTGAKVLEYCYAYDPAGQRYLLDIKKVSATIILFLILVFAIFSIWNSRRKKKQ